MTKPKIYKENGLYVCEYKKIKATGSSVAEAFLNFILAKISSNLRPEETEL